MSIDQTIRFDGNDLSPYLLVTDVKRQVVPKRRITQTQVPGMDGALVSSVELDAIEVTVSGCITRRLMSEVTEARKALAACLKSSEPAPLVLPDDPTTYLMALYEGGAELSKPAYVPDVDLTFLCADPVAYGQHRSAEVTETKSVRVGGSYPARPVVTVKPPKGSQWQITNVGTGEYVRVLASFTGSQTVVLDMGLERCTINGTDHAVDITSDFFSIEGDASLMVSGGTATVEWDERWL
jgi:predicted phage tail component-like protein